MKIIRKFWNFISSLNPERKKAMEEGRPFYIILTVILAVVGTVVIYNSPNLKFSIPLVGFIIVMVLHISLHWLSGVGLISRKSRIIYLVVQGVLSLIAVNISGAPELALTIFATMIGETIGLFGISRLTIVSVVIFFVLTPLSYLLIGGMDLLNDWLSPTLSTMTILISFMVLYRRQTETSNQAHALAEELEIANRQLTEYATQVENLTLTAERQRMARELHDTLAQGVAGLVLQLEAMKAHLSAGREERVATIIDHSLKRARSTLADSRAAIDDLRVAPANMSEAVKIKIERFTQATGIPCNLNMDMGDVVLPKSIENHVYRVLSEALANITRHAQASQIWVNLTLEDDQFELSIRDNGRGFNPNVAPKAGHYGVLGMRERARLIEGKLEIDSEIRKGTRIRLLVPTLQEN